MTRPVPPHAAQRGPPMRRNGLARGVPPGWAASPHHRRSRWCPRHYNTYTSVAGGQGRFLPVVVLQQGCSKGKRLYAHTYNYNTTTLLPHARI